jgi:hypothetical protein
MPDNRAYAAAAAALLAMPAGAAQTSRASLAVSATVVPACLVSVTPASTDGEREPIAAAFCTAGVEPRLTVDRRSGGGAPVPDSPNASAEADRDIVYLTLTY